ncbi:actin interacting protein 3-domain-containing protein [Coniella lustricola]|uniref:Actin interacting protein 3-domain-containing protein n=1 Tax=Coniella lustricola TaxID=2025994 RepID=A0A2T3A119_9PEZI|nr:actin interacting protein 3-domain-containing protein [Coniella lustricola]
MQAPGPSQRSLRRSPGAEPGPPPNVPARSISPAVGLSPNVQPRSSTASSRSNHSSHSNERNSANAKRPSTSSGGGAPLSQIEKSVTHLLVATKQLLETLTQWSRGQASDTQVSDVYVRLGYEFNMACRAFTAINVDTSDLGNVPELLRNILEATLSQEASVESLEKYLPRIRDIIINLLHGLKRKQQKLRQKSSRDKENGDPSLGRVTSTSTNGTNTGLSNLITEGLDNGFQTVGARSGPDDGTDRTSGSPRRFQSQRDGSRATLGSEKSSLSSDTMQSLPVVPPYPPEESSMPGANRPGELDSFPPPPPPPKSSTQSALAALQRGGDLERRASRRYSAYQISKHLGSGANGVPMLPTQTTPIPNRGRGEVRESLRAVQMRKDKKSDTQGNSKTPASSSPVRKPSQISEEDVSLPENSAVPTPEELFQPSATLQGPLPVIVPSVASGDDEATPKPGVKSEPALPAEKPGTPTPAKQNSAAFAIEQSPPGTPAKDLTLFLQYKSKVKKFVLPEGHSELSIGRLQLAFIEKFSWNTHSNGADLPEIYIQDPVSGVRHELEDLTDIKDRTVLVLNVEALDEVKKHVDDGLGSIKQLIESVKVNVNEQSAALQRVSERQTEAAKEIARLASAPPPAPAEPLKSSGPTGSLLSSRGKLKGSQAGEIQGLRRDLAVLRQTYTSFQSDVEDSMNVLRSKASAVKAAAAKASIPDTEGGSGHAYVSKGRKQLNTDSDHLVNKVDDLQDLVEDLRKDVVHRGVRPRPRQLETVAKDIQAAMHELKKMEDYMKREKPVWTKIWEKELEDVCNGRDEVKLMEDLMADLQDDLEKANETFALVEQATKEQMKDVNAGNTSPTVSRQFSRGLHHIAANIGVDPNEAKEGVLGEVRALQPNHEDRMEAIERAEKLRQKDLATRSENPIKKELVTFVAEGKLKKSGGFEEVERARKAKDDAARKEVWERMNGVAPAPADDGLGVGEEEGWPEADDFGDLGEGGDDDFDDDLEDGEQGDEVHAEGEGDADAKPAV